MISQMTANRGSKVVPLFSCLTNNNYLFFAYNSSSFQDIISKLAAHMLRCSLKKPVVFGVDGMIDDVMT